jgi:hypothetical protein
MWKFISCGLLMSVLSGCANFKAASEFAKETNNITGTVRNEFTLLENLCAKQAELVIVVNNIQDDGPLNDCAHYKAAQGRLAGVTLDVLDNYAKALAGLADDKSFDISSNLEGVSGKLQGLKDRDGKALVNAREVGALSKVVQVLFEIATATRREAAVKRLVDETPNLTIIGNVLRSFFLDSPDAPPGRAKAPYTNLIAIVSSSVASTEASLRGPALRNAEPIRTSELLRELQARKALLHQRVGDAPDRVAVKVTAAIDAWQQALEKFSEDALKPDPRDLYDRLKDLRAKTIAAKAAVEGSSK